MPAAAYRIAGGKIAPVLFDVRMLRARGRLASVVASSGAGSRRGATHELHDGTL